MHFRALTSPPSNINTDCSFSHDKPKCHCSLYWCAHPPAARALSLPKSMSSAGPESGWQLWKKTVWLPWHTPATVAWTILGGGKETGSSDHLSLWLMLQRVFWIWHVVAELMPACLVLTYSAGRQTCRDIKRGTLKRSTLQSPPQAGINNKLCSLSWPHTIFPSPGCTEYSCCIRSTPSSDNSQRMNCGPW